MEIVFLFIGLIIGGVIAWFFVQSLSSKKIGRLEAESARVRELETKLSDLSQALTKKETEISGLNVTIQKERESTGEKLKIIEDAKTNLIDTFKALSSDALKSNNLEFKGTAETLLKPLKEALDKYEKDMNEMKADRRGQYQSLADQIKNLLDSEMALKGETGKLVTALKAPQVRGRWGEITLRRTVELTGMVERCDFIEQESVDTPDGKLRPDMIVNLPNSRTIVIDAKTPLKAYMESTEATTDEERDQKMRDHARQVNDRVKELSGKSYWAQFKKSPEFVVLFLPGEQILSAALKVNPDLLEQALTQSVIIATPSTLFALLKAIAYGWREEALTENAEKIRDLGIELWDRTSIVAGHLNKLGKNIDESRTNFNHVIGSFKERLIPNIRQFKELGASGSKDLPEITEIEDVSCRTISIGYEIEDSDQSPAGNA